MEGIITFAILVGTMLAIFWFANWLGEANLIRNIKPDEFRATGDEQSK